MSFLKNWIKAHPKTSGLIAALAAGAAAYYGVPPGFLPAVGGFFGF